MYAQKSHHGGIIAPPAFIFIVGYEDFEEQMIEPLGTRLSAGTSLECYKPVKPGDQITVATRVTDMAERQGKRIGQMVLITFEMTYKNQRQELVAKANQRVICYQAEGAASG